jgi:hypothetical protein
VALIGFVLLCLQKASDVTCLESVVVLGEIGYYFVDLLWVVSQLIVLKVELYLLDRLSEHELMAPQLELSALFIGVEVLIDRHDLFEVKLLEVDVQSSDKEINHVALLQLVAPNASEGF